MRSDQREVLRRVVAESDCIEWNGHRNKDGYGIKSWKGKPQLVHRIVFDLYNGYLPEVVRHTCDNPSCYNVEHLVGGTMKDNTQDSIKRGRFKRNDGSNNPKAVLNEAKVLAIKEKLAGGVTSAELAKIYEVSSSVISKIKRGATWKNV